MGKTQKWMLVLGSALIGGALSIGRVGATPATPPPGFTGTQLGKGRFEAFSVKTRYIPPGLGGREREDDVWSSTQRTSGPSDLYMVKNVWEPGATTGWHTHPGHSLIIVTDGEITAYDGDDMAPRAAFGPFGDDRCLPYAGSLAKRGMAHSAAGRAWPSFPQCRLARGGLRWRSRGAAWRPAPLWRGEN